MSCKVTKFFSHGQTFADILLADKQKEGLQMESLSDIRK